MHDKDKVTVVIATRDRCSELRRTLIRHRALPEHPPVIVVDNGSTDGTAEMVSAWFPEVHLIALPTNRGATARNLGVHRARTPYVAFSDDDSWWEPGALAAAADVFDAHPRLAVLVARIELDDGRLDPVSKKMARGLLGREPDLPGPSILGFPACAAIVRRTAFLSVGGFNDLLFFGGEESLLALDLVAVGWKMAYLDELTAYHSPSRNRDPSLRRWTLHRRNDLLISWMRLSLGRSLRQTMALAVQAVHDPLARHILQDFLTRLPAALARRRPIPPVWERRLHWLNELE
jgi:GT2 family glycosyltransferase